jgi:hypothetical protein
LKHGGQLAAQGALDLGVLPQQVEEPHEGLGGGVEAGDVRGLHLRQQLLVGEGPIAVLGEDQHREQISVVAAVAVLADELEEDFI